jgi:hypothetical protein
VICASKRLHYSALRDLTGNILSYLVEEQKALHTKAEKAIECLKKTLTPSDRAPTLADTVRWSPPSPVLHIFGCRRCRIGCIGCARAVQQHVSILLCRAQFLWTLSTYYVSDIVVVIFSDFIPLLSFQTVLDVRPASSHVLRCTLVSPALCSNRMEAWDSSATHGGLP